MSHEIFGNRMGSLRDKAWHALGAVFEEEISAVDAIRAVGMDYEYSLQPVVAAVKGVDGKRTALRIPNKSAIVRAATADAPMEIMGIASDNYEIIQNTQFAAALDNLTPDWPLETLGALKGGRTIFFTLNAGGSKVGGDDIEKYFLVTDSKTGKESVRFMYTPVRVVCQNTLSAALSSSAVQGTLVHRRGVAEEFTFRTGLMAKLAKTVTEIDAAFEAMTRAVLTIEQRDLVFKTYWPMPKRNERMQFANISEDDTEFSYLREQGIGAAEEFERLVRRAAAVHKDLAAAHDTFNAEYPHNANTAWSVYNAVVEYSDWALGNEGENGAYSTLFGDRARRKQNIWNVITRMI